MTISFALTGHGDSGKTTFIDALMYQLKLTNRMGKVEEESTLSDFDPEEKLRHFSIDLTVFNFSYLNKEFNIIDTPGYPDFIAECLEGIWASDITLLFINASSGIMVNTRRIWNILQKSPKPVIIVISKIDLENIAFNELVNDIKKEISEKICFFTYPDSFGKNLTKVYNMLAEENLPENFRQLKSKIIEAVVEESEELLMKYLDGEKVELQDIEEPLKKAIFNKKIIPVFTVSNVQQLGHIELLHFIAKYIYDFTEKPTTLIKEQGEIKPLRVDHQAEPTGFVFKAVADPFVGKIAYVKVLSGEITSDTTYLNIRTGNQIKVSKIYKLFGKEQRNTAKLSCSDIGVITKIEELTINDTFARNKLPYEIVSIDFPIPMVSLAVEPKSKEDEQRLSSSLQKIADSDPTFKVTRDRQTLELVIAGVSNLHLDVALSRMKKKYGVEIITRQPKIPYKETITISSQGHYKHKKQTGGRGQYAEVYIKLEPLERGKGFEFVDEIFGGAIPNQFIPAVEKGIREVLEKGILGGYNIVDVRVRLYDGTYHVVDSSEAAFKIAASKAFKQAFLNAKPVLLEPIVNIEISVPPKFLGDITSDLNSRRGRIVGIDSEGKLNTVKAQIPLSEILTYATDLRSMTGGEGSYSIEFSHLDIVPARLQEQILAQVKKEKEEEEE
ncbi:MAG: elongation factor G [Planctomycetota bacterium]